MGDLVRQGLPGPAATGRVRRSGRIGRCGSCWRKTDPTAADTITFWDAGSPAYRWIDLVNSRLLADQPIPNAHRIYTYMTMAMYDATIAAWDSKYFYNRPRPSETDSTLTTVLPTPRSPSYPSEHAVTAGAAAAVLSHFFPDEAASFQAMAEEAAQSRVLAGRPVPKRFRRRPGTGAEGG